MTEADPCARNALCSQLGSTLSWMETPQRISSLFLSPPKNSAFWVLRIGKVTSPAKCREDREYRAAIALERTQGRLLRLLLLPGYSWALQAWLECRAWQRRFGWDEWLTMQIEPWEQLDVQVFPCREYWQGQCAG